MKRKIGFYEKYIKRLLDIILSLIAIILLSWLIVIVAILVRVNIGSPIIFSQYRPGLISKDGKEKIFRMYKFRTMTNAVDENGRLLSDEKRLTKFGKFLRSTSLDELPELFNILFGTMSIIGPRPQLVRDMVFMSEEQRLRHTAKPGMSGLAQVNGRNAISWEDKLAWDLKYIEKVSLINDLEIVFKTFGKVFAREGINSDDMATAEDYGDYLLRINQISQEYYNQKQEEAKALLERV